MSRRKLQWLKRLEQSGDNLEKLIPRSTKGKGRWILGESGNIGSRVTEPMSAEKEDRIRRWLREANTIIRR